MYALERIYERLNSFRKLTSILLGVSTIYVTSVLYFQRENQTVTKDSGETNVFFTLLENMWSDKLGITPLFILIIVYLFGIAMILLPFKTNERVLTAIDFVPGIITTLGILGTFIGIFIALAEFKGVSRGTLLNAELEKLLEGLKVAFGTSIAGLFFATTFRFLSPWLRAREAEWDDASVQDIIDEISKLRYLTSAGNSELKEELKIFSKNVSISLSKALVDELRAVINEFNDKLSQQLGDNFAKFNEAVGALIDLKNGMQELVPELHKAVSSIQDCEKSINGIEQATSTIPTHLEALSSANELLHNNLNMLLGTLKSFEELKDKAVNALPEIKAIIDAQRAAVEKISDVTQEIVEQQNDSASKILESSNKLGDAVSSAIKRLDSRVSEIISKIQEAVDSDLLEDLQESIEVLNKTISKAISDLQSEVNRLSDKLRKGFIAAGALHAGDLKQDAESINKSLEELQTKLGDIEQVLRTIDKNHQRDQKSER